MPPRAADEGPSSGGPREPETESVSATPTHLTERQQQKLLRCLSYRHGIEDTPSLVAAYNEEDGETEQSVLIKWLDRYTEERDERHDSSAILEYAELSKIKPSTDRAMLCLRKVVAVLSRVPRGRYIAKNDGRALYSALLWAQANVFVDQSLERLVENLLSSLSPDPQMFNAVFEDYEAAFFALRQAIVRLHEVSSYQLSRAGLRNLQRLVAKKRETLRNSFKYCPFRFHFAIIEKGIERLEVKDEPSLVARLLPCVGLASCSLLRPPRRRKAEGRLSIDAKELSDAFADIKKGTENIGASEIQWYDQFRALEAARLQTLRGKGQYKTFLEYFDVLIQHQKEMEEDEDLSMLRFGIIHELCQLSLHAHSKIGRLAAEKLLELTRRESDDFKRWAEDQNIFEALLEAVHRVHKKGIARQDTENALRDMEKRGESVQQNVVAVWLSGETIEDKLRMRSEGTLQSRLFRGIANEVGHIPFAVVRKNIEDLKRGYTRRTFTTVQAAVDREAYKQIKDMEHHIVVYEHEADTETGENGDPVGADEHAVDHYKRAQSNRKAIDVEDLFKPRGQKDGDEPSKIRKVLLCGSAGSGKTCISKVMAYKWAIGDFMQDIRALYVVPVRKLDDPSHGGGQWSTLEAAIANICYSHRNEPITESLMNQVDDELDYESTLLVLDGIDEGDEKGKALVASAKNRLCKMLLLSRPYNLSDEKALADLEVECLGFNDEQVEKYVRKELSSLEGSKLIEHAKAIQSLWEALHIPVTAEILCTLWKEGEPALIDENRKSSTYSLYTKMVNFLWARFAKRPETANVLREDILQRIESIAFEAFRRSQILINQTLVEEYASSGIVREVLKDSGFLLFGMEGTHYQFPHLTFQEYFVGRYLARSLNKGKMRNETSIEFLANGKYPEKNKTVISFAVQALAERHRVDELRELFSFIEQEPREIVGVQHVFLKLDILDAWAAGFSESKTGEGWRNDMTSQIASAIVRIVTELKPASYLWDVIMAELNRRPNILRKFPEVLNALTKESKLEDVINAHRFQDVAMLASHSPKHLGNLQVKAREKVAANGNSDMRLQGLTMTCHILARCPNLSGGLLPTLMRGCEDDHAENRRQTMLFVQHVLEKTNDISNDHSQMLRRGLDDEDVSVKQAAMVAIKFLAVCGPRNFDSLVPLIEKGWRDENVDIRKLALAAIGHLPAAPEGFQPRLDQLLDEGSKDHDESVVQLAKEIKDRKARGDRSRPRHKPDDVYSQDVANMIRMICKCKKASEEPAPSTEQSFTRLWREAEENKAPSIQSLVEFLIRVPVTVEQTARSELAKLMLHGAASQPVARRPRASVNRIISAVENDFDEKYPGISALLRSA